MYTVYVFRNKSSKRGYVGHTINLYDRIHHHLSDLNRGVHSCKTMQEEWPFEWEVAIKAKNRTKQQADAIVDSLEGDFYNKATSTASRDRPVSKIVWESDPGGVHACAAMLRAGHTPQDICSKLGWTPCMVDVIATHPFRRYL